jgi:hypothetical protein
MLALAIICIQEVTGSNHGCNSGYPEMFRGLPQYLQENVELVPLIWLGRFPSTYVLIHYSLNRPVIV